MHYVKNSILIFQEEQKHNALLDCELLREVYKFVRRKRTKFNLSNNAEEMNIDNIRVYNKSIVHISEDEIKKHKEFLKLKLKKNYY